MAILFVPGFRITDAAGALVSGGKVRVYDANTTNLSSLYSDTGLSSSIANPVVANSAGYPSSNGTDETVIFLAAGNYDVAILDASNNVLINYDDQPALGSDSAGLNLTLPGGTRYKVTDSGGRVLVQFGDASPDNVGGTATFEGWAGTQADEFLLDAALINTTGRIKENSKKLFGTITTELTTVSAVSSVDIALTESPSDIRVFEIEIIDFTQSGLGNVSARTSHDGGGTYKSGASDYVYMYASDLTGTGYGVTAKTTTTSAQLMTGMLGASNQPGRGIIRVITPESGNDATIISWRLQGVQNTGEMITYDGFAYCGATYGRATHLRLLLSANAMTFKYLTRAYRGTGDA